MKKLGLALMVSCMIVFGSAGVHASKEDHSRPAQSEQVEDKNVLYKDDSFGITFRKPLKFNAVKKIESGFRVGDDCDTFLKEACEARGNITKDTKIEFSVEYKSKGDVWYIDGGFGAIVTSEDASDKTADEILKQKIDAERSFYNHSSECSDLSGYFNQTIATEKFSSGWVIQQGKSDWLRKIFVTVKDKKAMIIYLDCSYDGTYGDKSYINQKIKHPYNCDDALFYRCFLKNSNKPSELGIYSVQSGDNLWKISERFYGKGILYSKVMDHNKLKSDVLRIGQSLRIPKL